MVHHKYVRTKYKIKLNRTGRHEYASYMGGCGFDPQPGHTKV